MACSSRFVLPIFLGLTLLTACADRNRLMERDQAGRTIDCEQLVPRQKDDAVIGTETVAGFEQRTGRKFRQCRKDIARERTQVCKHYVGTLRNAIVNSQAYSVYWNGIATDRMLCAPDLTHSLRHYQEPTAIANGLLHLQRLGVYVPVGAIASVSDPTPGPLGDYYLLAMIAGSRHYALVYGNRHQAMDMRDRLLRLTQATGCAQCEAPLP